MRANELGGEAGPSKREARERNTGLCATDTFSFSQIAIDEEAGREQRERERVEERVRRRIIERRVVFLCLFLLFL